MVRPQTLLLVALLTGCLLGGLSLHGLASNNGTWTQTGSMASPGRYAQTATLLHDGRVLVAGGFASTPGAVRVATASAELYNPATATWAPAASMNLGRGGHTASLLGNGTVLVVGGVTQDSGCTLTRPDSEIYDPVADSWTLGPSLEYMAWQSATTLADGRVVLIGGVDGGCAVNGQYCYDPTAAVVIYDPATNTMSQPSTACFPHPRSRHAAFLQPDGTVLVVGGEDQSSTPQQIAATDVYHPATATWSTTGSLGTGRTRMIAVPLPGGRVLVAGGVTAAGITNSSELFDPASGSWSATGSMVGARAAAAAAPLVDGTILASGGFVTGNNPAVRISTMPLASAELFNPVTRQWAATASMIQARGEHTLTPLVGGRRVLAAGGTADLSASMTGAELFSLPVVPTTPTPAPTRTPLPSACGQTAVLTVSPAVVPLGRTTRVSGTGFCPGPVTVTWLPGSGSGTATSDASGRFALTMLVFPHDIVGPRTVTAGGPSAVATASLLVVEPPVEPPTIANSPVLILRH